MNRRIKNLLARVKNEDGGFALPFIASMMILLLGISAFAIDLGWIYLNGGRLQRGADSAALAGVVYLPHDTAQVQSKAVAGANANGWSIGTVVPDGGASQNVGGGPDALAWNQVEDNKLRVQLTTSVDTFFLKVLGFNQFTLRRTATAQFIKPVPLGSPANCIGIGPGVSTSGLPSIGPGSAWDICNDYTQNFWSAINGPITALEHGDPYAPNCGYQCTNENGNSANHDPYYYFAIDVPAGAGSWVDVYMYDAAFYARSGFAETGDSELGNSEDDGTRMQFSVFQPDSSPQIPENNLTAVSGCSDNIETAESGYRNQWIRLCRIDNPGEGIYVLRVANRYGSSNDLGGTNSYSLLANSQNFSASAVTRVYSLNEMGIFTNSGGGAATVYIADVDPVHANKILELTFFDPGETSGNGTMTVVPPTGVTGHTCSWTATNNFNDPTSGSAGPLSGTGCSINTANSGNSLYNGEWITMQIQLPGNYTCNPTNAGCFWKMNLALVSAHDRTTWEARVIGNPVALVPNEP